MKRIDRLKSLSVNEFAKYLYENWCHDSDPVIKWFDEKYCSNCEPVEVDGKEYAWCEVNKKCKYFQELDEFPSCEMTFKLWLESEVDE